MRRPTPKARYQRMRGYNVFFPIGFDAFGLPAENAAIKRGAHPYKWTLANIEFMRKQLRRMGAMWAWDREAVSCNPEFYKWTQWFFRKLYDMGLAYREFAPVDWCPNCNTTLAREQVWGDDRHCERCGTPVIKKELNQWKFRITRYAPELLDGLATIDWPERVKVMQTNWIGRSEGAEVTFTVAPDCLPDAAAGEGDLVVFTTRPDTLWGATFMVLAPEHPLVGRITTAEQRPAVDAYIDQARRMDEITRGAADKEKTGVFTGAFARQPGQWPAGPHLDRRLRVDDLRHRRDHGRARARRARLRVCAEIRPADRAGHRARRRPGQERGLGRLGGRRLRRRVADRRYCVPIPDHRRPRPFLRRAARERRRDGRIHRHPAVALAARPLG